MPGEPELLILGTGPAACSAALSYRQLAGDARIVMTDGGRRRPWRAPETLAAPAGQLLRDLGCWERFTAEGFAACHGTRSVWGAAEPYENDFLFGLQGSGWHVDRERFDALLARCAREAGAEVAGATEDRGAYVIDATGRAARYAVARGARRLAADGLVAAMSEARLREGDAVPMVEAQPDGWWYSAGGVAAFFTDADLAREAGLARRESWEKRLAETVFTRERVEGTSGEIVLVAAQTQMLNAVSGPGWAAAGDAAMTVDPLSSQGVTAALLSGRLAAFAAYDWVRKRRDTSAKYAHLARAAYKKNGQVRREFYSQERRWADRPFWQRRLA